MSITIEKGVPIPARAGVGGLTKWPLRGMEVGDSFAAPVPEGATVAKFQANLATCIASYTRSQHGRGKQFVTRRAEDHSHVRVWRIEDKADLLAVVAPVVAPTATARVHSLDDHVPTKRVGRPPKAEREAAYADAAPTSRIVKGSRY